MPLNPPRDTRQWMESVNRQLREARQGVPNLVASVTSQVREAINTDLARTPDKPVELAFQTALYTETTSSKRWARVMADFPDVTVATDATPITVSQYELWGRDESANALNSTTSAVAGVAAPGVTFPGLAATPANKAIAAKLTRDWVLLTTAAVSSLEKDGFLPGSVWRFRIRAIGRGMAVPGLWSDEVVVQMVADDTPPPQPTQPYLRVIRGAIEVRWDGMSVAGSMPGDFRYLEVAQGESSSPLGVVARFYRGGGIHVASGFDYYTPQFFRFRAVDESGNASAWSAQSVAYSVPLVDTDVVLSRIDAAKTELVNVDAGVSLLADTIATRHLAITEDMTAALAEFLHVRAGMIEANAVEADNIQAGAISAAKLEAVLALVTAIIAGDPLGTHAQMDANGFRVFAADPEDGVPNEVVRMGVAASDDYFAITRSNGTLAAAISQDGVISGTKVMALESINYRGRELADLLGITARGNVAYGNYLGGAITGLAVREGYGIFEIGFWAHPGRSYEVHSYIKGYASGADCGMSNIVRFTLDGTAPTYQSETLFVAGAHAHQDEWNVFPHGRLVHFENAETKYCRMLIMAGRDSGVGVFNVLEAMLWVNDTGAVVNNTAAISDGGAGPLNSKAALPPPVQKQNIVATWGCTDSRSYSGGGGVYPFEPGQMFQGLSPAGYGNLKSIAVFNDMTAALTGATINYIRVYFKFNHWYYNSGGTARIGLHAHSGVPGSFVGNLGVVVSSGGWPKPGARFVDIPPEYWNGFRSGAYKGVYLEGDGSYGTYGYADRPSIEISYTK